ncbi:trafficking protein particle complex subunit 10 isoform X2 [Zootermopsis nevadensis]|uniref:trafficking protein particle complex subunit 10 isoform X2 n=1 Tax=Zootermopsis nevadensis TaxID=136037 RepID=UPI000B8E44BE|nr:trafficking protein particle complex subunit 10 isoform X2 [Zootermopsis nevadensis]
MLSVEKMNDNDTTVIKESCIMDSKPIITFAGDVALFSSLEASLVQALPQDSSEWRRSYGRAVKSVYVEASFISFSKDILPKQGDWHLIQQPIFHIFWTECVDLDAYKTTVREEIEAWLKILGQHNIQDWMIVLVETYDIRKTNKLLPRTTVLDKIRSDFASKHGDRCLSVINPIRSESRSAESWRGLLARIRHLLLFAYNRTLIKFEEVIRDQRERRNEPGWNFCQYFLLQEELAFVLEMLGLYDEALVQYDELDAVFTQFVLNSNVGDTPEWLSSFQCPFENWSGLVLGQTVNQTQRSLLNDCKASLLEFRSYLFSRQCAMLLLTFKPWEIAQRSLPFLHNCIKELEILEISTPPGAVACWVFLCCLEVLQTCERFNDSGQVEAYSLYTASLWAYARDKLRDLGQLCGLMPGCDPTSEQLHTVVSLSGGMGDCQGNSKQPTPTDKLKEALSSKEAFRKHYLELAELAMGTFKHIGRIRSARMIGRDLAAFYLQLGEMQKAAVFLTDALKTFEEENWRQLAIETQLELADCYRKMDDKERFIKTCTVIASAPELNLSTRITYFDEMMNVLEELRTESPLITSFTDAFKLVSLEVSQHGNKVIIQDSTVEVNVVIESRFPKLILCINAAVSVEGVKDGKRQNDLPNPRPQEVPAEKRQGSGGKKQQSIQSQRNDTGDAQQLRCNSEEMKPVNPALARLHMVEHLDYKQDKSLSSASIVSKNPKQFLRRTNSHGKYRKISSTPKGDFSSALVAENIILKPGRNEFVVKSKAQEKGLYRLGQLSLLVADSLEFLSSTINPRVSFEVMREPSSVILNKGEKDLLAGLEQEMVLTVSAGSYTIGENVCLRLRTSRGLQMQVKSSEESLTRDLEVPLPQSEPFQTLSILLRVLAELPPQKDAGTIEHKVTLQCPWKPEEKNIALHFQPPLMSSFRLHTAYTRKFVQILVIGLNVQMLELTEPTLTLTGNQDVRLGSLNPTSGQKLIVGSGLNVSFMWQLDVGGVEDTCPIKTEFKVHYSPIINLTKLVSEDETQLYRCNFDINDYKTLFVVKSRVEPTKGSEFCRAGTMCHLQLDVQRVNASSHSSLMYEVLADQSMWAVCGRTAGVISLDSVDKQNVTLDVMPLIGGFLPLPLVRLSKYIPADQKTSSRDPNRKPELSSHTTSHPRLEPFSPGQVYNSSKAQQVHVLPSATASSATDASLA